MDDAIVQQFKILSSQIGKIASANHRNPQSIKLLAVSKQQSLAKIVKLIAAGQVAFGENYVQEALPKITALESIKSIEWHFIGAIQTNKTRSIANHFSWVHSVASENIARRLNDQRPSHLPPLQICIEINDSHDTNKSGISLSELPPLIAYIKTLRHLQLRGLMTMITKDYQQVGKVFRELHIENPAIDTLSMGMSQDFPQAIAAGATLVRIGTLLFGERHHHDE